MRLIKIVLVILLGTTFLKIVETSISYFYVHYFKTNLSWVQIFEPKNKMLQFSYNGSSRFEIIPKYLSEIMFCMRATKTKQKFRDKQNMFNL